MKTTAFGVRPAWTEKTALEMRASLALLTDVVGDKPVLDIDNSDYDKYFNALAKLPPNWKKSPQTRGMTVAQIISGTNVSGTLSQRSILKHHSTVRQFIEWVSSRYPAMNLGIRSVLKTIDTSTRSSRKIVRLPFDTDQLKRIFESEAALRCINPKKPYQAWLSPIAVFTGMRLGEICQLRLENISTQDGVATITVADCDQRHENSQLKTLNSKRALPIHQQLIALGFLEFIDHLRSLPHSATEGRLFGELRYVRGHGYKKVPSRWFNSIFLKRLGIKSSQLVFHSFRHLVSYHLNRATGLDSWRICRYLGHSLPADATESLKSYNNVHSAADLLPVIDAIHYDIDWRRYQVLTRQTFKF